MKAIMLHPLGYELRPRGHELDHFQAIEDTMTKRGHTMLQPERIEEADVLMIDNNVWNLDDGGTSPYDWPVLQSVIDRHLPVVYFDNFDHAGSDICQGRWPGSDDWRDALAYDPEKNHLFHFGWLISRPGANPFLFFMRKMQVHQKYPDYVLPLEYPLFEDYPLVSQEELNARPFDVCGLANLSQPRKNAMDGLRADGRLKLDCELIHDTKRLTHDDWIDRHRQAKFFLEADASLGSERPMRLMTVAPMLRIKSDHKLPFPRTDMVHQVEIGDYDGHIERHDVDKLLTVLNDPDLLYLIYKQGAEHMRKHYSLEARSNYVVDLIEEFLKTTNQ
jgi:hypothetical protein